MRYHRARYTANSRPSDRKTVIYPRWPDLLDNNISLDVLSFTINLDSLEVAGEDSPSAQ